MSATEVWCLVALVLALASAVLCAIAPRSVDSYTARAAAAALAGSVAAVAAALWVALP